MIKKQWKQHQKHRKLGEFGLKDPLGGIKMEEKKDSSEEIIDEGKQSICFVRKTPKGFTIWLPDKVVEGLQ